MLQVLNKMEDLKKISTDELINLLMDIKIELDEREESFTK